MREYRASHRDYPRTLTFAENDHVSARGFAYDRLITRMEPDKAARLHPREIAIVDVLDAGYDREISGLRQAECAYTGAILTGPAQQIDHFDCYHCKPDEQCPRSGTCRIRDHQRLHGLWDQDHHAALYDDDEVHREICAHIAGDPPNDG